MDRLAYYRRWKLGEDPHALAKEAGVTRERMRHMLAKMDAQVPLVDQLTAAEARVKVLEDALRERDGGRHDQDCRFLLNTGRPCNCGHVEAIAALEGEK